MQVLAVVPVDEGHSHPPGRGGGCSEPPCIQIMCWKEEGRADGA